MPQSATKSILPIQNPELSQKSESSSYNWKTLTKAGLVFVTTTGAFLTLKATGSFNLINSWWKNLPSETDLDESSALANPDNPSPQSYTIPVSNEQALITHQYTIRQPANETVLKIGSEFQISTQDDLHEPSVAKLIDGKFVVTYHRLNAIGPVYGQLFNSNGTKYASEFQVSNRADGDQRHSQVASLSDGKFVVVWLSYSFCSSYDCSTNTDCACGQLFNSDTTKYSSEFVVTGSASTTWPISVVNLNDGKFIVTWNYSTNIRGQIYNADGSQYGNWFKADTCTTCCPYYPSAAKLNDGKFVIAWQRPGQDGDGPGVFGQQFYANSTKYLSEFQANTYTVGSQANPSVTGLNDGKFAVTWLGEGQGGTSIYGQLFDSDGNPYASEFQVSPFTSNNQYEPFVTKLNSDRFIVTWGHGSILSSKFDWQVFKADGSKYSSEFMSAYASEYITYPVAAGLSENRFVLVWDFRGPSANDLIYGQLYKVDTSPVLENNNLVISKGETITLTTNDLSATDEDDDDTTLTFTVSDMQHGQFELKSNPGTPITTFIQQQIIDGNIQFIHDNDIIAPTYQVSISDEWLNTDPAIVTVTFSCCVPIGPEFQVNTYTTSYQGNPSITGLSDGKFIVTWESGFSSPPYQDGDGFGIYGQMYNTNGDRFLSEFQVNTYTTLDQVYSSVAGLSDGKFVITWHSDGQDVDSMGVYGQMFNANGTKFLSEFQVNTYTTLDQGSSSVAGLSDGKFVVTWSSDGQDGDGSGIYGQMFHANGTKFLSEFQVNTHTVNTQAGSSIAVLNDGKFVVTWQSNSQDGDDWGIYGQMFNANGTKFLSEFQVNTYTTSGQGEASIASLSNGKFTVTWRSSYQDGDNNGVYGQLFNNDGSKYFSEFRVNTYAANNQRNPSIANLNDNKFVVTWESLEQDGDGFGIYGQMFNADGTKFLSEFQVNTFTTNPQVFSSVASLGNNRFVVTWTSSSSSPLVGQDGHWSGVYGQMFGTCTISNSTSSLSESTISSSSSSVTESISSNESNSETIISSSPISQSIQNGTSASISSISKATEASNETSTLTSSSKSSLSSSGSKTSSSTSSTTKSTSTSSKTSESEIPSSPLSASESTTHSKISESNSKSMSKDVSSTQALSGSSNSTTTSNKSILGIILGSIGGIISTILGVFGVWLKYKKYKTLSKMRQQNPLAAGIYQQLNFNISGFESDKGKKYLGIIGNIINALGKRGIATDEMDQEELRTLTLSSVKVIEKEVKPKKSLIGRKQIPVEDLEDKKDSITKKIIKKFAKESKENEKEIKLQIIDDESEELNVLPKDKKESTVTPTKKSAEIDSSKLSKFKKIGQGAMGTVYKAQYLGSDVAVKKLPIIAADSEELEQFEQEAKLMKKLRHPHLVNFYGYYQDETHYSIVMEYVSGGSLDKILYDTEQPFPWSIRWDVAHDVASGVSFLHDKGIIHRDLKSQNILVYYEKDRTRAKVADIGIAKIVKQETLSTMTKGAGTPLWMAPEVIEAQGEKEKITYDEKVDVYSYGIILSELINRNLPYSEVKNAFQIIPQVLEGKRPDFDETSAPADFVTLMQRCWTQRAEERPEMQKVVDTLDEIQDEVQSFEC